MHDQLVGYFLDLPPGFRVTVNGHTYIHEPTRNAPHNPFFIGPLPHFTVIEFLSQPLFFYRSTAALDYTEPLAKRAEARPSADELRRRDGNGNVDIQHVDLAWTPLSGSVGAPILAADNGPAEDSHERGEASSEEPSAGVEGDHDPPGNMEQRDEVVYDDEWLGKNVSVTRFLNSRLLGDSLNQVGYALARVLMAINERQADDEGLSNAMNQKAFRPGRPLIVLSEIEGTRCLVIFQVKEDADAVSMYLVDPMWWNKSATARLRIFKSIKNNLDGVVSSWGNGVFDDDRDLKSRISEDFRCVPCPQVTCPTMARAITVLTGWAIAMGYTVNPDFTLGSEAERGEFVRKVRILVTLTKAPQGKKPQLHWKLVLAFLREYRLITDLTGLPAVNRRFDARTLSNKEAEKLQLTQHERWQASGKKLDLAKLRHTNRLGIDDDRNNSQNILTREYDPAFRQGVVRPLIEAGKWTWASSNNDLEQAWKNLPIAAIREPRTDNPENNRTVDQALYSNPCAHLSNALASLRESHPLPPATVLATLTSGRATAIDQEYILACISAVVGSINGRRSLANQIGLIDNLDLHKFNGSTTLALMPWTADGHTVLVLLQAVLSEGGKVGIYVLDSAPWVHTKTSRLMLYNHVVDILKVIGWIANDLIDDREKVSDAMWVFGAPQCGTWESGHYTVLNALTVLLGLEPDVRFKPNARFRLEFAEIMNAVQHGRADWSLIASFLRCIQFAVGGSPCDAHRFESTVAATEAGGDQAGSANVGNSALTAISDSRFVYSPGKTIGHSEAFFWDELRPEDGPRVKALQDAGLFRMNHTRDDVWEMFPLVERQFSLSTEEFPEKDRACKYFRETMNDLLKQEDVQKALQRFHKDAITTPHNKWIREDEAILGIACVTEAISTIQNNLGGFGLWMPMQFNMAVHGMQQLVQGGPPVRFGKPIMLPIAHQSHIILAVIQLDETASVSISILDTWPYHWKWAGRLQIFETIWGLIEDSEWGKDALPDHVRLTKPDGAFWIPRAHQVDAASCGWLTILSGWALALGLELNRNFNPIMHPMESNFFSDLLNLVRVARAGYADWRLIYAFLRCHRFVHEGIVPNDRRFNRTLRLMDETSLEKHQELTENKLEELLIGRNDVSRILGTLRFKNHVTFPQGTPHYVGFPGDDWREKDNTNIEAHQIAQFGKFRPSFSVPEIHQDFRRRFRGAMTNEIAKEMGTLRSEDFIDQLKSANQNLNHMTHEQIVSLFGDYVLQSGARKYMAYQLRHGPTMTHLKMEACTLSQRVFSKFKKQLDITAAPRNWSTGQGFTDAQINLAIAAVVQAIDRAQANRHQLSSSEPFSGGFALAAHSDIAKAKELGANTMGDENMYTSRPRRPWLLPLSVSTHDLENYKRVQLGEPQVPLEGNPKKHTILAVIQEVKSKDKTKFQIHFLDSRTNILANCRDYLYQQVIQTAYNLNWPSHRTPSEIHFEPRAHRVQVAQATRERSTFAISALHTILNAWILALGLTPNPAATFERKINGAVNQDIMYSELFLYVLLAISGLLQWQNIVAYLVTNGYVLESIGEAVKVDREFGLTAGQTLDEGLLKEYVERVHDGEDQVLLAHTEEVRYDVGNCVVWRKDLVGSEETRRSGFEGGIDVDEEEEEEEEGVTEIGVEEEESEEQLDGEEGSTDDSGDLQMQEYLIQEKLAALHNTETGGKVGIEALKSEDFSGTDADAEGESE